MKKILIFVIIQFVALLCACTNLEVFPTADTSSEQQVIALIREDVPYTMLPAGLFEELGWGLPDDGMTVKELADRTPGSAVDPMAIESLSPAVTGYSAKWHEVRYPYYGLEWDITGLYLEPADRMENLPTLVLIHGGSSSWYTFFLDPLNGPAMGQYLAQKIPVLMVTIPGNYKPGGWKKPLAERIPAYLLDAEFSEEELRIRNALFTFSLISEGVFRLIDEATEGQVLIAGHSTGGDIQFLLKERIKSRLHDLSIGWGTGGPAIFRREWVERAAAEHNRGLPPELERPITEIRTRGPEEYTQGYIGPLNPLLEEKTNDIFEWYFRIISDPDFSYDAAQQYFQKESSRKPFFKQIIQDIEHTGRMEALPEMERTIRKAAAESGLPIDTEKVMEDLFSTVRVDVEGYRKMVWTTAVLDEGHWDPDPQKARELFVANQFRKRNPNAEIRVIVYETLLTHMGHLEKPKQMAGALMAAVKWLCEDER
ncbi:hypothetical protein ACFL6I_19615 [candidate division KSB1 bacterium]